MASHPLDIPTLSPGNCCTPPSFTDSNFEGHDLNEKINSNTNFRKAEGVVQRAANIKF